MAAVVSLTAGFLGKVVRSKAVAPTPNDTKRSVVLANAASELADLLHEETSDLSRSAVLEVRWQPLMISADGGGAARGAAATPSARAAARFAEEKLSHLVVIGEEAFGESVLALQLHRGLLETTLDLLRSRVPPRTGCPAATRVEPAAAGGAVRRRAAGRRWRSIYATDGRRRRSLTRCWPAADLLILDGLDEIHQSARREPCVRVNSWFARGLPHMVICRRDKLQEQVGALVDVGRDEEAAGQPSGVRIVGLRPAQQMSVEVYLRYGAAKDRKKAAVWARSSAGGT